MTGPARRQGVAYLTGHEDDGKNPFIPVWIEDGTAATRMRVVPVLDADKERFLAHMRGGGSFSLTEAGTADERRDFKEGVVEGFESAGGIMGRIAERMREKPIDTPRE